MAGAFEAALDRRSWSKVTDDAPTHRELLELVAAAGRVADHSSLQPWRLIELRGDDRERLGRAINKSEGEKGASSKPLRAPLLIAVVLSPRKSHKVPEWEQEAVASGVAHLLSLLLDEAGWGVIWRTGHYTRTKAVAKARTGGGPTLIESVSLRWRGHAGHDAAKYVPKELLDEHQQNKDPVARFRQLVLDMGVITQPELDELQARIESRFAAAYEFAQTSPFPEPGDVTRGLYTDDGYWTSEPGRGGGTDA